jgi:hypothetical protein
MKQKTLRKLKWMKRLLDGPHKAFFWVEHKEGKLYYTYPVGGWYVGDKDDCSDEEVERTIKFLETTSKRIVFRQAGKI